MVPPGAQTGATYVGAAAGIRRLAGGGLGTIVVRGVYLAVNEPQWESLWQRHFGGEQPAPVDFSREVAVVVAQGEQRTAGYSVQVVQATWDGPQLRLKVEERRPGPGMLTAQVITHPYDAVAVARPAAVRPSDVTVTADWVLAR